MSASITLPMWLIIVIGGLAAWALLDHLLMPSMRWWVKSRANRVLDEVGRRLKIGIRPFQQVKRQLAASAVDIEYSAGRYTVAGVGELGTIGATPAVVNAVVDALDHAGLGRGRAGADATDGASGVARVAALKAHAL